jgi:hypothetical protein
MDTNEDRLDWHAAFREALRLEFDEYSDVLDFEFEHQLNTKPLQIDAVIIKKKPNVQITKSIGRIFLGTNIVEYKSPDDYVSVRDFLKACAYVGLYLTLHEDVSPDDITLSLMESRYPKELIVYLKNHGCTMEIGDKGIDLVKGLLFPVQIIETQKLPEDEDLWLRELRSGINESGLENVLDRLYEIDKMKASLAYLSVVLRANKREMMEVSMKKYPTLEEIFIEAGFTKQWEARGETHGRKLGEAHGRKLGEAHIIEMLRSGKSPDELIREYDQKQKAYPQAL